MFVHPIPLAQLFDDLAQRTLSGHDIGRVLLQTLLEGVEKRVRDLPSEGGVGFGSTEFIVLRAARAGSAFAYCLARYEGFRDYAESGMSGASGRQRARTESVAAFPIAVPSTGDRIYERFERIAWPMLELAGKLGAANSRLAAARDLLLPRLISGELTVGAASRDLGAAA